MQIRFRYLRDPVFIFAAGLYALNRLALKPLERPPGFFHSYFNDLLCIPFLLPPVLCVYRGLGLRWDDRMPTRFELFTHLVVWSVVFEGIAPRIGEPFAWSVADPLDVVAYWIGGVVAGLAWGVFRPVPSVTSPEIRLTGTRQ